MAAGKVNRTTLQSYYQNAGEVYEDTQTEGAVNTLADQIDANWDDYKVIKDGLASKTVGSSGGNLVKVSPISGLSSDNTQDALSELKSQLNDAVIGVIPGGAIVDSNVSVTDANSHFTATKLDGVLDELFTFANSGKTSIANVVGSPTLTSDTFTKISTDIQTQKTNLATNLTSKGQSSVETETLKALVDKVANVNTGKKFATGTVTSASTTSNFQFSDSTTTDSVFSVTVNGLAFKPSLIFLIRAAGTNSITIYTEIHDGYYGKTAKTFGYVGSSSSFTVRNFKGDISPANVSNGGFTLPVSAAGMSYTWLAIE